MNSMDISQKVRIEDLCLKVTSGGTPSRKKTEFYSNGSIPWLKTGELKEWFIYDSQEKITEEAIKNSSAKIYPKNTVLMAMYGDGKTIGSSAITAIESSSNQACCAMIVDEKKCLPLFLLYSLQHNREIIVNLALGGAQRNLNQGTIKDFEIYCPSVSHQKVIVEVISNYDRLIENNNRRIAILEDMAQSLYREWFVNFRYPDHKDHLDADISTKLVDSPLGKIPEGWEVKSLCELVEFKRKTIKKGMVPERTPYMGLEHFPRKSIALAEWEEVSEIGSNKLAFSRGDILFGKIRPNFHKVGVAQVDGLCSSDTFVLSPKETAHHSLIAMVTFSNEFVAQAVQTAQGSKMPRASWDVLKEFSVCLPDIETLKRFNSVVNPVVEQIRVLSLKNRNLKQQRDILLPKIISGQIELKD